MTLKHRRPVTHKQVHQATNQDDAVGDLGDTQTSQANNSQTGNKATNQYDAVCDLGDTQSSQASNTQTGDQAIYQDDSCRLLR